MVKVLLAPSIYAKKLLKLSLGLVESKPLSWIKYGLVTTKFCWQIGCAIVPDSTSTVFGREFHRISSCVVTLHKLYVILSSLTLYSPSFPSVNPDITIAYHH